MEVSVFWKSSRSRTAILQKKEVYTVEYCFSEKLGFPKIYLFWNSRYCAEVPALKNELFFRYICPKELLRIKWLLQKVISVKELLILKKWLFCRSFAPKKEAILKKITPAKKWLFWKREKKAAILKK